MRAGTADGAAAVILTADALRPPLTGVGRYVLELARALQQQGQWQIRLLAGSADEKALMLDGAALALDRWIAGAAVGRSRRWPLPRVLLQAAKGWRQARLLRRIGFEGVLHGTAYYLPPYRGPSVVTVHDLSPWRLPETHPLDRALAVRWLGGQALRRADVVITHAEAVRQELLALMPLPPEAVVSIPLAAAAHFHPREPHTVAETVGRWGLEPHGYSLYLGTVEPRKNLNLLFDAYAALPWRHRWPLVIVGRLGWKARALYRRIVRAQAEGWLRWIGFVDDEQAACLMAAARLALNPSRYEGFGLPVLEAMACRVPVLCADIPVFREVAGDAALYHHPDNAPALTAQLGRILCDDALRHEMAGKGLQRARAYSWARTARLTAQAYTLAQSRHAERSAAP